MSSWPWALCVVLAAGPLDDARRHYQRLEYDQALAVLETARRQAGADTAQLAQVWLLEAFVQLALGRQAEGTTAMRRALRLDSSLALPAGASPKLEAAFVEARKAEAERRARRAAVAIRSYPVAGPDVALRGIDVAAQVDGAFEGLEVRLAVTDAKSRAQAVLPMSTTGGGRFTGRVPAELAQPGARLQLGFEAADEGELIASESKLSVEIPLHRAAIEVSSPHEAALVEIDGSPAGSIPLAAPVPVEPGRRLLLLHAKDGDVKQEVVVAPGEIAAVTLAVAPGASKRVRFGIGLVASSAGLLITSALFAVLSGVAAQQLAGAVRREPGSELPLADFTQARGFERNGTLYLAVSITAAVLGALLGVVGGVAWFGA